MKKEEKIDLSLQTAMEQQTVTAQNQKGDPTA